MRRSFVTLVALAVLATGIATAFLTQLAGAQGPPPGGPGGPPPGAPGGPPPGGRPGGPGGPPRPFVWNQAHADSAIDMMLQHIKGKENMPAESVYKNIKILNGMPAKSVPKIMWYGFARGVGMSCGGCHVRDDFSSDDKPAKRVARAMWTMSKDINGKYLASIKEIEDDTPVVNCWTCHRGQHEPEFDADHPRSAHEHPEGGH